jgi:hypothetical protein
MMARIESRGASNFTKTEAARQNAINALDLAVSQLQKHAGPDQRVTARAEIFDAQPDTPVIESVNQPYWTGAWKSGDKGLDIDNDGVSQRELSFGKPNPDTAAKVASAAWLVSGSASQGTLNPLTFSGVTSGSQRNAVVIASKYVPQSLMGVSGTQDVIVPLVDVKQDQKTTGAYAYWDSDEGVKAKINIKDPTLGADPVADAYTNQLHFLAPQAMAAHRATSLLSGTDLRLDADTDKVVSLQSLNNIKGLTSLTGTALQELRPDFTTYSFGVLSDARRGGLKKDLTAAFEQPDAFADLGRRFGYSADQVNGMAYRNDPSLAVPYVPINDPLGDSRLTDGMPWFNLYAYYGLYKKGNQSLPTGLQLVNNSQAPKTANDIQSLPLELTPRVFCLSAKYKGGTADLKLGGVVPEVIAMRMDIGLSSYQSPTTGKFKLRLHYYPQMVLHNPYNCRIALSNFQFQRNIGVFSTAGARVSITVTVTEPGKSGTTILGGTGSTLDKIELNQTSASYSGRLNLITSMGQLDSMEPGETRIFGLGADSGCANPQLAISATNLVSSNNPDFSQYCDLPGPGTTAYESVTPWDGVDSPNAVVSVSISDKRLRSQNTDSFVIPGNLKWPNAGVGGATTSRFLGADGGDVSGTGTWPSGLTIASMNNNPRQLTGFFFRKKGVAPVPGASNFANGTKTPPLFHGNAYQFSYFETAKNCAWGEVYMASFGSLYGSSSQVMTSNASPPWQTFYGDLSAGVPSSTSSRKIFRDVPTQPLVSLGQFMHAPTGGFYSIGAYQTRDTGAMPIGGSYPSPFIDTSANIKDFTGPSVSSTTVLIDDSFMANDALFDRFFFSTVPQVGAQMPPAWVDFNRANPGDGEIKDSSLPLLNTRMKPYYHNGQPPLMASLRDMDKAAANLLLDGAFNVNSTSILAWKSLLASLSGNSLRLFASAVGETVALSDATLRNPIPRFWSGSLNGEVNKPWEGMRSLSDEELDELARRIVEQVKLRGPFLSISDFLNRRLGPANNPLSRAGALQAAIDSTDPDINANVKSIGQNVSVLPRTEMFGVTASVTDGKVALPIADNLVDYQGRPFNTTLGIPGYLMQQDLVQAFSPLMAARSDTFVVRCYGEARNPKTGAVEGRAWGEAVVQRTPNFVDETDLPESDPKTINATNRALGRAFKVVSFRWLSDSEI